MAVEMASQFSEDGKYFAQISADGKLKVWDTVSNVLDQEFTPDFHLTSPCTCLHFLNLAGSPKESPKKKKRRDSVSNTDTKIVLGTTSGLLFVYSIAKANVEYSINSNTSQAISCISLDNSCLVYSGSEQNVLVWDLSHKRVNSTWKTGNEKVTAILIANNYLLTASRTIKLWNPAKKQLLHTYTGHSSDVTLLRYVNPRQTPEAYFVSGSKGDRLLSCWNLGEKPDKSAVISFLMDDVVQNVSLVSNAEGSTCMAAITRSGVVNIYEHTLNGKCVKPLKPKTKLQVVSDTGQTKGAVVPIRIVGGFYRDFTSLCIGHGTDVILTFENVQVSSHEKVQCLIRKDPKPAAASKNKEAETGKVRTPIVNNDVLYTTPQSAAAPAKRKPDGQQEVPMEQRLENLALTHDGKGGVPKADNVAQLLVQGLHSKDKNILQQVLMRRDETVIRNTVRRLPITVIVPLVAELNNYLRGKTQMCQIGALWMRHILQAHSGMLISNPLLPEQLSDSLSGIESRMAMRRQLGRLQGRLSLLVTQINGDAAADGQEANDDVLVFNVKDTDSDSEEEMDVQVNSDSDNPWEEDSVNEDNEEEEEEENHVDGADSSDDEDMEEDDDGDEDSS